jgi:rubredoxin
MKKWVCTICGYVHEGPEPPDECPVCGADKSQFELLSEDGEAAARPAAESPSAGAGPVSTAKWRCLVCGYIHEGPQPPEECPVCGADKSQFERVAEESAPEPEPAVSAKPPGADSPSRALPLAQRLQQRWESIFDSRLWYGPVADLAIRHHVHPISVHVPNGTLPIAVFFLFIAAAFHAPTVGLAAFYNMIVIFFTMPIVIVSGVLFWKRRYGGHLTQLFKTKLICAAIVLVGSLFSVLWHLFQPAVSADPGFLYLLLHIVVLGAAGVAGYMGGRLVFHKKGS